MSNTTDPEDRERLHEEVEIDEEASERSYEKTKELPPSDRSLWPEYPPDPE